MNGAATGTSGAASGATPGALSDRVRALFSYAGTTNLSYLLAAVSLVLLFSGAVSPWVLGGWSALFAAVLFGRSWLALSYARAAPADDTASARWLRGWNSATLASGALWGAAALLFYGRGEALHQLAMVLVIYAFCVGSTPMLAWQPRIFYAYIGLSLLPTIAGIALHGGAGSTGLLAVAVLIFAMTARLGRNYRNTFEEQAELKARALRLAEQLRLEKAAAEAARGEAELANRAKTRFLAAASHDLRQPLHALGLFAEALRRKGRDDESMQLIDRIHDSVDALDGLFSELMDITKIDTGGVQARPVDFQLGDVFDRLRLHFEPIAFEKGLALRVRGGHRHAFADPVLVERILRNLTSNAIRYTDDGGVLVSARVRGQRLLLQVWDSGVGIHDDDRERVFDEFVQVHEPARAPDPNQRKGLGLGLAIVRRLAVLLSAPLRLQSTPGRGSVFTLELPLGKAPAAQPAQPGPATPPGATLAGRVIVTIEDDPAVRSGPRACPYNLLYRDFLMRHETRLAANPRTVLQVRNLNRLDDTERAAIAREAAQWRASVS